MLWTFRLESIKAGVGTMSYDDSLYPSSAVRRQFHHCSFWIEIQLRLLLDCPISRDGPIQNSPASIFRLMQWVGWKYAGRPNDQGKSFKVKSKHHAIAKIAVVILESKVVKLLYSVINGSFFIKKVRIFFCVVLSLFALLFVWLNRSAVLLIPHLYSIVYYSSCLYSSTAVQC